MTKNVKMVHFTENNLVMGEEQVARLPKVLNLELTEDGVPDAALATKLLSRVYYERTNNKKWPA